MNEVIIEIATINDAQQLLDIYEPYVKNTPVTFEYTVPSVAEFARRIATTVEQYPYLKAVVANQIVGYCYAGPFKTRAAFQWAVETSIYLDANYQGQNIAKALYGKMEEILKAQNIYNLTACITYPNPQSIRFHEKLCYQKVAHFHRCGFKLGGWHDVIWMEKILIDHDGQPKKVIPFQEVAPNFFPG